MKKFLSVVLAFLMLAVMLPTTALADTAVSPCVAKIGDTGYDSLDNAIKAAANEADPTTINLEPGVTVYLSSGVANEGAARNVEIVGNNTQTVDVITNAISAEGGMLSYQRDSRFVFKGVIIQAGEGNFDGIVCGDLTFENCTIKGKLTLYGAATFTGCTFQNTMADQYSIWTWGGTAVTVENCTFNTNGKAILLYGQATAQNPTNLVVNNCTFNDRNNGSAGKAAIEIGNDYNATYKLTVTGATVNGFAPGKNTGSKLWGNKNGMTVGETLTMETDRITERPYTDPTTSGTITIIVPSTEDTPKTDDQKNPATGANDLVAVAVAAAALALAGSAIILRKD